MITPQGTGAVGDNAPRGRRGSIGAAVLVVVGGLIAVGILTSPSPSAVEETTTSTVEEVAPPIDVENFTVEQIATGEPLDWWLSMAIDNHQPLALFEHDETLYLFTDSATADSGGLRAWRSGDGIDWEALGEVIPADHEVTTVDSTVQGLVATSNRLADNALVLWESADAIEWAGSEIPTGTEGPYFVDVASGVGANQTTLVVTSNTRYDRERLLEGRLREIGIDFDLSNLSWNLRWVGEDGHRLIVRGPVGIPVLEQPIDALALSDEEREELLSELFDPLGTNVWVRGEDEEWQMATIEDTRSIDSILTSPDGRLIAYGPGASGRVAKISADGIDWEPGRAISPGEIEEWSSGFVGGVSSPELMMSGDGTTWHPAGLSERFPNQMGWSPTTLGAGDGGAAMLLRGSSPLSSLPEPTIHELKAQDGTVFTVDANGPGFQVFSDDGRHRWTLDGAALDQDAIAIDIAGETVILRDPKTGEALATFEFAEIEKAQHAHAMATLPYALSEALAFTENGEEWVIQDMAPEIGDTASIALLEVTASRVVAIVRNTVDSFLGDAPPGFEVWSAPVP